MALGGCGLDSIETPDGADYSSVAATNPKLACRFERFGAIVESTQRSLQVAEQCAIAESSFTLVHAPVMPLPVNERKSAMLPISIARSFARARTAAASGCSLARSRAAATLSGWASVDCIPVGDETYRAVCLRQCSGFVDYDGVQLLENFEGFCIT